MRHPNARRCSLRWVIGFLPGAAVGFLLAVTFGLHHPVIVVEVSARPGSTTATAVDGDLDPARVPGLVPSESRIIYRTVPPTGRFTYRISRMGEEMAGAPMQEEDALEPAETFQVPGSGQGIGGCPAEGGVGTLLIGDGDQECGFGAGIHGSEWMTERDRGADWSVVPDSRPTLFERGSARQWEGDGPVSRGGRWQRRGMRSGPVIVHWIGRC